MKKLLLMYPNFRWSHWDMTTSWSLSPSRLCLLAAMVKDIVEVKILDCEFYDLSLEEFSKQIKEYMPDYVGISIMCSEYSKTLHIAAKCVKEISPEIIVISGGVHATIEYKEIIKDQNIDYVIRGEGEHTLRKLLLFQDHKGAHPIEGIVFKNGYGHRMALSQSPYIKNLDELPMPAYDLVNMDDYMNKQDRDIFTTYSPRYPYIRMSVTRGCGIKCGFCQVEQIMGKKTRTTSPEKAIKEILYLQQNYGLKSIIFDDDNILGNRKFFMGFFKLFSEKVEGIDFFISAFPVFLTDVAVLDILKKAGCVGLNIAVESGNKRVLKEIIHKPINLDKTKEIIIELRKRNMFCVVNFIIGLPEESWNEIQETIFYAEHCNADYVKIFIYVPLKNTKLWEKVENNKNIKMSWRFNQIKSDEWSGKDISALRVYMWDKINFNTPEKRKKMCDFWGITKEKLNNIRKRTREELWKE